MLKKRESSSKKQRLRKRRRLETSRKQLEVHDSIDEDPEFSEQGHLGS